MKKLIQFSKFFPVAVILSAVIIISGIISVITRGINFGLDFKPGMIEEIKISNTVLEVTYNGTATVSLDVTENGVDVVVSGIGEENRTESISFDSVSTVSELAAKINSVNGVSAHIKKEQALPSGGVYVTSGASKNLGENPLRLFVADESSTVTADDIRAALKDFSSVDVKEVGSDTERAFQIRMGVTGEESKTMQGDANKALTDTFGADKIAISKSDFIGAQYSQSLIRDSIILVLATLVLIFIYSAIRFHWDFALAAVIAIIHDSLIMVSFISFIQMEFSTTTLAAILTIIGYSINATVVILDRVRSDIKVVEAKTFKEILNSALTSTLSRSIITTLTTLFAVLALFFFTTGTIHDFSLALTVGLISGCYSSIFIAGAFILSVRKNQKFTTIASKSNISQFKPAEDETDDAE
ncbi:MAG: protein translocase subunit SecF [Treponema sp.]|uniref:protein translocase subunit SecF n=1 Tax=Treponema sp. TaxID=166 RepID=UPI0025F72556|nr:protein translocase subunit SecF [Treponema sp.]MBQ8679998.1 protein translocase subunit SecF [Treponema sp.]